MQLRRFAFALAALVAVSGFAQAQEEAPAADEAPKLSSSRQREIDRWKRDLGLSESQAERITKLFAEAEAGMRKVLTADQRETLESRSGGSNRGGFGGFGGGGRGGMGGMMSGMTERILSSLTEEVGLDEKQQAQAKEIMDKAGENIQKTIAEIRETGDWGRMRTVMRDSMEATSKEIREILTPEQQTKYDEFRQNMEQGGWRGRMGGGGRDRGRSSRRGTSVADRLRAVLADLNLSEDEKMVLEPTIKSVLEAQDAAAKATQEARDALRTLMRAGGAAGEDIAAKMQAVRDAEKSGLATLTAAQDEVRTLVTMEQEAILLAHGVLG